MKLTKKTLKIRELNDEFRKDLFNSSLGITYITKAIQNLPNEKREELIKLVKNLNDFSRDNDPYGEHDFGVINLRMKSITSKLTTITKILNSTQKTKQTHQKQSEF